MSHAMRSCVWKQAAAPLLWPLRPDLHTVSCTCHAVHYPGALLGSTVTRETTAMAPTQWTVLPVGNAEMLVPLVRTR